MLGKILFLGHDTSSGKGFYKTLVDHSAQVLLESNPQKIERMVKNREVELLVCAYGPESKDWNIIIELTHKFPRFPILNLLVLDNPIESQLLFDGYHKVIRPLTDREAFIQEVKDLIQVGQWRELEDITAATAIPQFFESLDLNHVVDRLLQHFGEQVDCKNLFWLQTSELERYIEAKEISADLEEAQRFNRSAFLQALHDATELEVFGVIDNFPVSRKYIGKPISLATEDSFSRKHLLVPVPSGKEDIPVAAYLVFENVQTDNAEFLISQVQDTLNLLAQHIRYTMEYWAVQSETFMDDLTELYNQRYMGMVLENEINRASRKNEKFSVLFLDVDFFKVVNDTRGHWIGSKVLIELGKMLKNSIRKCDYAFRYGGDEYVMVLPDTAEEGATVVAERIRQKIEKTVFNIDGVELNVTVSIGLAVYPDHATSQRDVIRMADEAMYCGKNKSRNIVYVAG